VGSATAQHQYQSCSLPLTGITIAAPATPSHLPRTCKDGGGDVETPLRTDGGRGLMDLATRRDESRNRGICRRIMLPECCLRPGQDRGDLD
jgi:hypothetical protein